MIQHYQWWYQSTIFHHYDWNCYYFLDCLLLVFQNIYIHLIVLMTLKVNESANGSKGEKKLTLALRKKLEVLIMSLDQRLVESCFQKQWSKSKSDKCELLFTGSLLMWTVIKDLVSIYKTTRRRGSGDYWIKWKIWSLTVMHQDLNNHLTRVFM